MLLSELIELINDSLYAEGIEKHTFLAYAIDNSFDIFGYQSRPGKIYPEDFVITDSQSESAFIFSEPMISAPTC